MDAPDDYLQMSGIQHFAFCRRQWALAYLEQQWAENLRTTEGHLDHARCHDDTGSERRGNLLITRGMRVALLAEGVDRNHEIGEEAPMDKGRPPRGGRG